MFSTIFSYILISYKGLSKILLDTSDVETVNGSLTFSVANEDLLDYISRKGRNAYNFLYCYFVKVLSDSGFMKYFEEYAEDNIDNPIAVRDEIYDRYFRLINGNTPSILDWILGVCFIRFSMCTQPNIICMTFNEIKIN